MHAFVPPCRAGTNRDADMDPRTSPTAVESRQAVTTTDSGSLPSPRGGSSPTAAHEQPGGEMLRAGEPSRSGSIAFRQRLALCLCGLWWGGLTVYLALVVPIGGRVLGETAQGFVTQQVTWGLNGLAAGSLAAAMAAGRPLRSRVDRLLSGALVLLLAGLVVVHLQLDTLLDSARHAVLDPDRFYGRHRVYLWLTLAQWGLGGWQFWRLTGGAITGATNGARSTAC